MKLGFILAYNKDLEQGIQHRVRGTDFKRILIAVVQVRKDPRKYYSTKRFWIFSATIFYSGSTWRIKPATNSTSSSNGYRKCNRSVRWFSDDKDSDNLSKYLCCSTFSVIVHYKMQIVCIELVKENGVLMRKHSRQFSLNAVIHNYVLHLKNIRR